MTDRSLLESKAGVPWSKLPFILNLCPPTCGGSKLGRHQLPMQSSITQSCFTPSCLPRICHPVRNDHTLTIIIAAKSINEPNKAAQLPQSSDASNPPPHPLQGSTLHPACTEATYRQPWTAADPVFTEAWPVTLTVWRTWSPTAEATHEVVCAHGQ